MKEKIIRILSEPSRVNFTNQHGVFPEAQIVFECEGQTGSLFMRHSPGQNNLFDSLIEGGEVVFRSKET